MKTGIKQLRLNNLNRKSKAYTYNLREVILIKEVLGVTYEEFLYNINNLEDIKILKPSIKDIKWFKCNGKIFRTFEGKSAAAFYYPISVEVFTKIEKHKMNYDIKVISEFLKVTKYTFEEMYSYEIEFEGDIFKRFEITKDRGEDLKESIKLVNNKLRR